MVLAVVLDAGPLGELSNPRDTVSAVRIRTWLARMQASGHYVFLPEIADYEVRRELIRSRKPDGLARLDRLGQDLEYLAITRTAMRRAAEYWAVARNLGRPTAPDLALDADVILAAQASCIVASGASVVVATTNPSHLVRYVDARLWHEIT